MARARFAVAVAVALGSGACGPRVDAILLTPGPARPPNHREIEVYGDRDGRAPPPNAYRVHGLLAVAAAGGWRQRGYWVPYGADEALGSFDGTAREHPVGDLPAPAYLLVELREAAARMGCDAIAVQRRDVTRRVYSLTMDGAWVYPGYVASCLVSARAQAMR